MKEIVLSLARASIKSAFEGRVPDESVMKEYPFLIEKGASFVTLTREGELRGCIGSLHAERSLYEDILYNARAAAFKDPRFPPLDEDELPLVTIEVSLLSEPKPLDYTDAEDLRSKVRVGIDGVVLQQGYYRATFLPQVWEQLGDFEHFFSHLCLKAGLGGECWREHPEISLYQVEKIKE